MESKPQGFRLCLIGATGAIGKEIVRAAMDPNLGQPIFELTLIVRRKLEA